VKRTANDLNVSIQLFMSLPNCLTSHFRLIAVGWHAIMIMTTFCELIWLDFLHPTSYLDHTHELWA
jgi:hypothetical protein